MAGLSVMLAAMRSENLQERPPIKESNIYFGRLVVVVCGRQVLQLSIVLHQGSYSYDTYSSPPKVCVDIVEIDIHSVYRITSIGRMFFYNFVY